MEHQESQTVDHSAAHVKHDMVVIANLPMLPLSESAEDHPQNNLDLLDHLCPLIYSVKHDHPYCQKERK